MEAPTEPEKRAFSLYKQEALTELKTMTPDSGDRPIFKGSSEPPVYRHTAIETPAREEPPPTGCCR
jgi:hypothetical protein